MRSLARSALTISLGAALLGGCSVVPLSLSKGQDDTQPPAVAPGVVPQTQALAVRTDNSNYKTVYSFSGGSDGANPEAGLIDVGGTLYGTTFAGGSYSCAYYRTSGCGTVFSVTPSGTEQVLHGFGAHRDGSNPRAGLIDVGGTFYGTTEFGGYACYGTGYYYSDCGTVYSITPSGAESVLFSFGGRDAKNGSYPLADLIDVKGTLYGTTRAGGGGVCYSPYTACGVVYSITAQGGENVLHSFSSGTDGAYPDASLIELKGKLYGTTYAGAHHFGTVFRITLGGKEKVLHHFGTYGGGGINPHAGLTDVGGTLYGTTYSGGAHGYGTVFSLKP